MTDKRSELFCSLKMMKPEKIKFPAPRPAAPRPAAPRPLEPCQPIVVPSPLKK